MNKYEVDKLLTYLETVRWYSSDDVFQHTVANIEWKNHDDYPDSMPLVIHWDDGKIDAIHKNEVKRILALPGGRPGLKSLGHYGPLGTCMWCGEEVPESRLEEHEDACRG